MIELTCFVLSAVLVSITSVYAGKVVGPGNIQEFNEMIYECAKEHKVKDNDLHTAMEKEDVSGVNPCFWTCCLKRAGFLDVDGRYILDAGLAYARKFLKRDDAYTILENVATQCESVPLEKTKCERGAIIATCFVEQLDRIRFFAKP